MGQNIHGQQSQYPPHAYQQQQQAAPPAGAPPAGPPSGPPQVINQQV